MNETTSSVASTLSEATFAATEQPIEVISVEGSNMRRVALPPNWKIEERDDQKLNPTPRRKVAKVRLHDDGSFIDYIKRHGSLAASTTWCNADYSKGSVAFLAILNDHGEDIDAPAWRDHTANFSPEFSEEWNRWTGRNKQTFTQSEFAAFIEENLADIVSADNGPTGAQMLEMALAFEANQDMRFKSAIRLQNGGIQMSFVQDGDDATLQKMALFDRFSIGIPVFWNGDPYRVDARLRYRARDGKVTFWFELLRHDKVLEAATQTLITLIREKTGNPFFFGEPFTA